MNGDTIKEFLVGLGFDIQGEDKFSSAVNNATLLAFGLGTAAVAAAAGIFSFVNSMADAIDASGDLADRLDTTVNELDEIGYVAQLSGSSIEASANSMEGLSKAAGDAANGVGRAKKTFEQLGISVTDANGKVKNSLDLMFEVGEKIKDLDKSRQIAILQRLGIDKTMINALTSDVSGLRAEFKALYDAAGYDANQAAEKAGKFMDSLDKLKFTLSTVGKALSVQFMDRFTESMDTLRKLIIDNLPKIMKVVTPLITLILTVSDVFLAFVYRLAQGAGVIIGWVGDIITAFDGWGGAVLALVAAWKYLNLAFLATPVGAILALIVALGLLIDDFMTFKEGGESFIPWQDWETEINAVIAVLSVLKDNIGQVFTFIFATVDALIKLLSGDFEGAWWAIGQAVEALANILRNVFGGVIDFIAEKVRELLNMASGAIETVTNLLPDFNGGPPALAPSPMAAGRFGGNVSQNNQTVIHVNGGADAGATGRAVAREQSSVSADMARNLKGAVK